MWRIDLQLSLGHVDNAQRKKSELCANILHDICAHFKTILPVDSDKGFHGGECRKMMAAAADLARSIRLSTASYTFQFVHDVDGPKSRVMTNAQMAAYDVINAETGLPVRNGSNITVDKDGRVGEKLCIIRPGLVRVCGSGSKDLVLVKPSIIVNFDHKVVRERKKKVVRQEPCLLDDFEGTGGVNAFM
jgi:hypothetical protein